MNPFQQNSVPPDILVDDGSMVDDVLESRSVDSDLNSKNVKEMLKLRELSFKEYHQDVRHLLDICNHIDKTLSGTNLQAIRDSLDSSPEDTAHAWMQCYEEVPDGNDPSFQGASFDNLAENSDCLDPFNNGGLDDDKSGTDVLVKILEKEGLRDIVPDNEIGSALREKLSDEDNNDVRSSIGYFGSQDLMGKEGVPVLKTDARAPAQDPSSSNYRDSNIVQPTSGSIKYDDHGFVVWGSISALVQKLLEDSGDLRKDEAYRDLFLASYRSFISAQSLLDILLDRFEQVSEWIPQERANARVQILSILEQWLKDDCAEVKDIRVLKRLGDFSSKLEASAIYRYLKTPQKITELINGYLAVLPMELLPSPCSSTVSIQGGTSPDEDNFARVLTGMALQQYKIIKAVNYLEWLEGREHPSPLTDLLADQHRISLWASQAVLRPHSRFERTEVLKYFIKVIQCCIKLKNFLTAWALWNGLSFQAIKDLKRTFGSLDRSAKKYLAEMDMLFSVFSSPDRDFGVYRNLLKKTGHECLPWMFVHLRDLEKVHRSQSIFLNEDVFSLDDPRYLTENIVNFRRCRLVNIRIRNLLGFRGPPDDLVQYDPPTIGLVRIQLEDLEANGQLLQWIHERSKTLLESEQTDYENLLEEKQKAGILHPSNLSPTSMGPPHGVAGPIAATPYANVRGPNAPSSESAPASLFPIDLFHPDAAECLDDQLTDVSPHPVAGGGYSDIYRAKLNGSDVAIKVLRIWSHSGAILNEERLKKRLRREYKAWTWTTHPIVLPCLGYCYKLAQPGAPNVPALVSPWMEKGTLSTFMRAKDGVVRLRALRDVADGLAFLHDHYEPIVHGDIRGGNIFVSDTGQPCLGDFGLSKVLMALPGMTTTMTGGPLGSLRWMSPELIESEAEANEATDIWAFAMTILEVLSGKPPYSEVENDVGVLDMLKHFQLPIMPSAEG